MCLLLYEFQIRGNRKWTEVIFNMQTEGYSPHNLIEQTELSGAGDSCKWHGQGKKNYQQLYNLFARAKQTESVTSPVKERKEEWKGDVCEVIEREAEKVGLAFLPGWFVGRRRSMKWKSKSRGLRRSTSWNLPVMSHPSIFFIEGFFFYRHLNQAKAKKNPFRLLRLIFAGV